MFDSKFVILGAFRGTDSCRVWKKETPLQHLAEMEFTPCFSVNLFESSPPHSALYSHQHLIAMEIACLSQISGMRSFGDLRTLIRGLADDIRA